MTTHQGRQIVFDTAAMLAVAGLEGIRLLANAGRLQDVVVAPDADGASTLASTALRAQRTGDTDGLGKAKLHPLALWSTYP